MVKRPLVVLLFLATLTLIMTFPCYAGDEPPLGDEYREMIDALPPEVSKLLPTDVVNDTDADPAKAVDFWFIVNTALSYLGLELDGALRLFSRLIGILVLAAVLNAVKDSFSPSIGEAFSICASCAVFASVAAAEVNLLESVLEFFSRINEFTCALIPLTGTLYAMGGNVGGAVVSHSSLTIFLSLNETFCASTVRPLAGICIAFAAASAMSPETGIGGVASFFKKFYTGALTLIMTLFGTVMGAQSLLASKSDNLAGKAAKYAVGKMIPVVGTSLSGTLGTLRYSVEYIRSSVGVVGIAAVILLLVPTLASLILTKAVLSLAGGASDLLGCGREKRIIADLSDVTGFLLASAAICAVTLVFLLTVFSKCAAAV